MKKTQFELSILEDLNKFRENPQSITHTLEIYKKGLSRIKSKDPLIQEIDRYKPILQKMKPMPKLQLNLELTKIAEQEAKKFSLNQENYKLYQSGNELKNILPNYYLTENPSLLADIGSDDPKFQIAKLLLNKSDIKKKGRSFITDILYTQIGIGLNVLDNENFLVFIFANNEKNYVPKEKKKNLNQDLSELKQAFDLFDYNNTQTIKINDTIDAMKYMKFDKNNPELFKILEELSFDNEFVSWEKFSSYVDSKLQIYNNENNNNNINNNHNINNENKENNEKDLKRIFNLCIDNPSNETITFETFKKICNEIGENISENEMKHILQNLTEKGDEMTFNEFCKYIIKS